MPAASVTHFHAGRKLVYMTVSQAEEPLLGLAI